MDASLVLSLMPLPFSLSVILTVGSVTLEVTHDRVFGTIHPPRPQIVPSGDEYEQIFENFRKYMVSVRKIQEEKV